MSRIMPYLNFVVQSKPFSALIGIKQSVVSNGGGDLYDKIGLIYGRDTPL